jgi:hypothetical protein
VTGPGRERPILFQGAMVRAIQAGQKTQTRRIAKEFCGLQDMDKLLAQFPNQEGCRYGKPGDRLWVREAWSVSSAHDYLSPKDIPSSARVDYAADGSSGYTFGKGRPSIFMPRWASRITLENAAVRVERLQNISEADARAEGVCELSLQQGEPGAWWTADPKNPDAAGRTAVCAYRKLWEKIHGPGSWDVNPYVWVVEFRQVTPSNQPTATEP